MFKCLKSIRCYATLKIIIPLNLASSVSLFSKNTQALKADVFQITDIYMCERDFFFYCSQILFRKLKDSISRKQFQADCLSKVHRGNDSEFCLSVKKPNKQDGRNHIREANAMGIVTYTNDSCTIHQFSNVFLNLSFQTEVLEILSSLLPTLRKLSFILKEDNQRGDSSDSWSTAS